MNVRPAAADDREQIRAITRDSLESSYSLSPEQIESILEAEFDDSALTELFEDAEMVVFVVEEPVDGTDTVRGFVTVELGTAATIRWLHVDPAARGEGAATVLLKQVHEQFGDRPIEARILDEAVEGGRFLEKFGLEPGDHDQLPIGSEEFDVTTFTAGRSMERANEPAVTVPDSVTVDGRDRPIDHDESVAGTESPFFRVYTAEDREEAYGYFCSQCGGTNVSTDGLDRLECGNCGNTHLADQWDDAYL